MQQRPGAVLAERLAAAVLARDGSEIFANNVWHRLFAGDDDRATLAQAVRQAALTGKVSYFTTAAASLAAPSCALAQSPTMTVVGTVADSAGTLCNAAQALLDGGASSVTAYITHGVLSGGAVARVNDSALEELVITDSILATDAATDSTRIRYLSIAPLIGEAVRRIADESSVSSLFD